MSAPRVAVVGAGIVGLAAAFCLVRNGHGVIVIDRESAEDKASHGNAGGIAVTEVFPASSSNALRQVFKWILDPLGPVAVRPTHAPRLLPWLLRFATSSTPREIERISLALAAINTRAQGELIQLLEEIDLSDQLHPVGALSVYESEAGYLRDAPEWACKRARGVVAQDLTAAEARELEPALGPIVHRAVFTPQWSHVSDPRHIAMALRQWLMTHGVDFQHGEVQDIRQEKPGDLVVCLAGGRTVEAEKAVIAGGAWSGAIARRLGDPVLMESERGYTATLPSARINLTREVIFAERKFVATPLSCGVRIGGAAEFGGLKARPNFERSRVLVGLAKRYLPNLNDEGAVYWAGHRPTTPDSLPVIGPSERCPRVFYAFGHGHLGFTQAAMTGRLVSDMLRNRPIPMDMTPYRIQRFAARSRMHNV